jgi:putative PEP-CTERM system TPR-repeat lipoprotein
MTCRTAAPTGRSKWLVRGVLAMVLALSAWPAMSLTKPEQAIRFYEDALKRYERSDWTGAIIQLESAVQQDARMLPARVLLGHALFNKGHYKAAKDAFEDALKLGVDRSEIAVPLARAYLALSVPELVIERLSPAGLPARVQVELLTLRGTAYAESGDKRRASASFAEARALDPNSVTPLIAEIPILLTAGEIDRAKTTAARAISLGPRDARAWNMQAGVLHATRDFRGALDAYGRALALDAGLVDARVGRAALLIDLNRDQEAEKDLTLLKASAPNEPRAAYLRAIVATHKGDTRALTAALNEVTNLIDGLPGIWVAGREQLSMLGALAHHGLGNLEKARRYLQYVLARNPDHVGAGKLLASIFLQTNNYPQAIAQLESLRKTSPDDPQIMLLLGSAHLAQHRYVVATDFLEKAARLMGTAEANRTLALGQIGLGRDELGLASLERAFAADPADGATGMTLALFYSRRGNLQKALQVAETMARRDPANLTTLNFLGTVKCAAGDYAGGRATYMAVLGKAPQFRPATLNLAKVDVAEGRFDDGRKRLMDLLKRQNADAEAIFELGMLEQQAGRLSDAARQLERANEVQRYNPGPGLALVDLQLSRGRFDDALAVARGLASNYDGNVPVELATVRALLALGDTAGARTSLATIAPLVDRDAALLADIARLNLRAKSPDAAFHNVQKGLQFRPDDPGLLQAIVEVEAERGDWAKADAALRALGAKHPKRVETALAEAQLAMVRKQYAAAANAYRIAVTRESSTANALQVARAYIAGGESAKAAAFLKDWVAAHQRDVAALKGLAEAQYRAGLLKDAKQSYDRLVTAQPEDSQSLNNYANLLLSLGDRNARAIAERAVQIDPKNASYADTLGWILVQQGDTAEGVRYLRDARLRNPQNGQIRLHLAYALAKAGRTAEAREELATALLDADASLKRDLVALKQELGL